MAAGVGPKDFLLREVATHKQDLEGYQGLQVLTALALFVINVVAWAGKMPSPNSLAITNICLASVYALTRIKFLHLVDKVTTSAEQKYNDHHKSSTDAQKIAKLAEQRKLGVRIVSVIILLVLAALIVLNVCYLKAEISMAGLGKSITIFILLGCAYAIARQKKT